VLAPSPQLPLREQKPAVGSLWSAELWRSWVPRGS